jgi:hypothetical protein
LPLHTEALDPSREPPATLRRLVEAFITTLAVVGAFWLAWAIR